MGTGKRLLRACGTSSRPSGYCLGPRLPGLRCPRVRPEGTCHRTCSARVGGAGGQRKGGGRREGRPQGPRPSGRGLGVRAARARSAPESRLLTWQNPCSRPSLFSAGKVLPPGLGSSSFVPCPTHSVRIKSLPQAPSSRMPISAKHRQRLGPGDGNPPERRCGDPPQLCRPRAPRWG